MKFKSERIFDMSQFGWKDCKFVFEALTWGEQKELDKARLEWQDPKNTNYEDAANKIVDILKGKFLRGQAIDDKNEKVDVSKDDFENIPYDVLLKIISWVTVGDIDENLDVA